MKIAIEIVDCPMENGGAFPSKMVNVYPAGSSPLHLNQVQQFTQPSLAQIGD